MDKTAKVSGGMPARVAILAAFRDIILEGGYENCRVLDVVERSGVARSTFYEHFESREDLLRNSLRVPFEVFACLTEPSCEVARVAGMLGHVAENRELFASLMADPGIDVLIEVLAEVIETSAGSSVAPIEARAVAGAQLAVLSLWLRDSGPHTAQELARELRRMSLALVSLRAVRAAITVR
jgi:AcrR family transcriptional regulator